MGGTRQRDLKSVEVAENLGGCGKELRVARLGHRQVSSSGREQLGKKQAGTQGRMQEEG